ncbi:hypothetical protein STTU_5874 [Streptomyces sp. Tu6071]|nr:hypothetical protein STTU_5874 [Streptomyces sp. Tu6071]
MFCPKYPRQPQLTWTFPLFSLTRALCAASLRRERTSADSGSPAHPVERPPAVAPVRIRQVRHPR